MILGLGIDIIEIERIRSVYDRWGESFLKRVFTGTEIDYCLKKRDPAASLAARFAAKEAAFKALSQAGVKVSGWKDIEIETDSAGKPFIRTGIPFNQRCHLSLSHSKSSAVAAVIIEQI